MCALVGSYDLVRFKELIELNSYRGAHSWSCTIFNSYGDVRVEGKGLGTFDNNFLLQAFPNDYIFGHIQSPTTEARTIDSVHPAASDSSLLWHNGIILNSSILELQTIVGPVGEKWDTRLLANLIDKEGFQALVNIKGSFSCARYTKSDGLHFFRNEISPLFYDPTTCDISSTKFEGSVETDPFRVYDFNFRYKHIVPTETTFFNNEQPFFFIE